MAAGKTNEGIFPSKCNIKSFLSMNWETQVQNTSRGFPPETQKIRVLKAKFLILSQMVLWVYHHKLVLVSPPLSYSMTSPFLKMQCPSVEEIPKTSLFLLNIKDK